MGKNKRQSHTAKKKCQCQNVKIWMLCWQNFSCQGKMSKLSRLTRWSKIKSIVVAASLFPLLMFPNDLRLENLMSRQSWGSENCVWVYARERERTGWLVGALATAPIFACRVHWLARWVALCVMGKREAGGGKDNRYHGGKRGVGWGDSVTFFPWHQKNTLCTHTRKMWRCVDQ